MTCSDSSNSSTLLLIFPITTSTTIATQIALRTLASPEATAARNVHCGLGVAPVPICGRANNAVQRAKRHRPDPIRKRHEPCSRSSLYLPAAVGNTRIVRDASTRTATDQNDSGQPFGWPDKASNSLSSLTSDACSIGSGPTESHMPLSGYVSTIGKAYQEIKCDIAKCLMIAILILAKSAQYTAGASYNRFPVFGHFPILQRSSLKNATVVRQSHFAHQSLPLMKDGNLFLVI